MTSAIAVGDHISNGYEEGIVCTIAESLYIMRCVNFHSYTLFHPQHSTLVKKCVEPNVCIRDEVVERIQRYVKDRGEQCTGE